MSVRRARSARSKPSFDVDALRAVKHIGAPTIAPDGRLACASVTSCSTERNAGTTEPWLYPTGSGYRAGALAKPRRLTAGDKDSDPRWSSDGTRIAFTADFRAPSTASGRRQRAAVAAASSYMNGHSDRYRAFVCHAGCYDWVSMMA